MEPTLGDVIARRERQREEREFADAMLEELTEAGGWMDFDLDGECADGCVVEPDGACVHGYSSWLLVAGLI